MKKILKNQNGNQIVRTGMPYNTLEKPDAQIRIKILPCSFVREQRIYIFHLSQPPQDGMFERIRKNVKRTTHTGLNMEDLVPFRYSKQIRFTPGQLLKSKEIPLYQTGHIYRPVIKNGKLAHWMAVVAGEIVLQIDVKTPRGTIQRVSTTKKFGSLEITERIVTTRHATDGMMHEQPLRPTMFGTKYAKITMKTRKRLLKI